ncbi:MAG: hypothetical protein K6T78_10670 [Alicyclobacillus sp.]|nr:hypothetical protein [Alicyclobacillus sp.]
MTDRHEGNRMRLPKVGRGMFVRSGRQVVNVSSLFPSSAVKRASYGILVRKEIMTYGDEGAGQRSAIAGYSGEIV